MRLCLREAGGGMIGAGMVGDGVVGDGMVGDGMIGAGIVKDGMIRLSSGGDGKSSCRGSLKLPHKCAG